MVPMDRPFVVPDGVEWTDTGGEVVLLDIDRDLFFGLNEIASVAWRYLSRGHTLNQAIQEVLKEYNAKPEVVTKDLTAFVGTLVRKELLLEPPSA